MPTPTLFPAETLAVEIGCSKRMLDKALSGIKPDGRKYRKPAWRITTALKALNRDVSGNGNENAGSPSSIADEIERTTEQLQAGLDRAAAMSNLELRRAILTDVGPLCGKLDRLMASQDGGDFTRTLLHDTAIRAVIGQFQGLWTGSELEPDQQPSV